MKLQNTKLIKMNLNNSKGIKTRFQDLSKCFATVRDFFEKQNFQEVFTANLVDMPAADLELNFFSSEYYSTSIAGQKDFNRTKYLRTSPEIEIKKLLAQGLGNCFEIATVYRNNGERGPLHRPEFFLLEFYQNQSDLHQLMDLTEKLVKQIDQAFLHRFSNDKFNRISIEELFLSILDIHLFETDDLQNLLEQMRSHSPSLTNDHGFIDCFFILMLEKIEPELKQLEVCFVYDYPAELSSLANVIGGKAKRCELYIDGIEISNGFEELTGKKAHQDYLSTLNMQRTEKSLAPLPIDQNFLELADQLPNNLCGKALGVSRLLATLHNQQDINLWSHLSKY